MALKTGDQIHWIKDELPPLKSPNTDLMVAWLTCGGKLAPGTSYVDSIEETQSGPKRTVTYLFDGSVSVDFTGIETGVSFETFRKRWLDDGWIDANPDHPISFLKIGLKNNRIARQWIREQKPAALIKRGNKIAFIPADCPEHRKQRILSEL